MSGNERRNRIKRLFARVARIIARVVERVLVWCALVAVEAQVGELAGRLVDMVGLW